MDISIKCQLSLSKKLRALIQNGETKITMVANNITDGRGEAKLIISSTKDINKSPQDFFGKETSIQFVPLEMEDVSVNELTVGTIFSKSNKPSAAKALRTIVDRIAVTEVPDDGEEAHAIKTKEEVEEDMPEPFKITKEPSFKKYINDLDSLDKAVNDAKYKSSDINIEAIQDRRQKAEAIELKEKSESIGIDAFIVNDKCANLAINDLGINLVLNMPYNLNNLSAKRILVSRDLRAMFNAGLVRFIKPSEIDEYVSRAEQAVEKPTLEVYSTRGDAAEASASSGMHVEAMPLEIDQLDQPTENEMMATNLTRPLPKIPGLSGTNGTTRTMHGNVSSPRKIVPPDNQENAKGIKTIKRTGLQY